MAELLLDQIRSQIRERVRELELELVARECERLEAALTALGGPVDARPPRATPAPKPVVAVKRRSMRSSPGRRPAPSGPHGEQTAPPSWARARPVRARAPISFGRFRRRPPGPLCALLKRLEESCEVAKEQMPGGTLGYRLVSVTSL